MMHPKGDFLVTESGWDKSKNDGIILVPGNLLNLPREVLQMACRDPELLNTVYKEISEKLGMETALEIYQLFKGQQVTFPMRFFNSECIRKIIIQEYDGTNLKKLAVQYGYSEKTIRRIIRESDELK
jgi:Mor family transcriptional regulator